jgi:hypothetical protein
MTRLITPRRAGWSVLLLSACSLAGAAEGPPEEKTGIKVGEKAPAFALKDQSGKERSLADLLKKGNVALVFHRSAGW